MMEVTLNSLVPLSMLKAGTTCIIDSVNSPEHMRRRLLDLGFSKGTQIKCVQHSPSGDPTAYMLRGTVIALRKEDASHIIVRKGGDDPWA